MASRHRKRFRHRMHKERARLIRERKATSEECERLYWEMIAYRRKLEQLQLCHARLQYRAGREVSISAYTDYRRIADPTYSPPQP